MLEAIEVVVSMVENNLPWRVSLDRKVFVTGTYDPAENVTTWVLPYGDPAVVGCLGGDFGPDAGSLVGGTVVSDNVVKAPGDFSAGPVTWGIKFRSTATLSQITMDDNGARGKGRSAITDGRLQLISVSPLVSQTGYLMSTVAPVDGDASTIIHTPRKVGGPRSVLGNVIVADARFRVPVYRRNTDVSITFHTDSHLPCSILSVDWQGLFTLHSRRV